MRGPAALYVLHTPPAQGGRDGENERGRPATAGRVTPSMEPGPGHPGRHRPATVAGGRIAAAEALQPRAIFYMYYVLSPARQQGQAPTREPSPRRPRQPQTRQPPPLAVLHQRGSPAAVSAVLRRTAARRTVATTTAATTATGTPPAAPPPHPARVPEAPRPPPPLMQAHVYDSRKYALLAACFAAEGTDGNATVYF